MKTRTKKYKPIPPVPLEEPDWPKIIYALKGRGYTLVGLMSTASITRERLYSVLMGRSKPQWYQGEIIRRLYEQTK